MPLKAYEGFFLKKGPSESQVLRGKNAELNSKENN